MASKRAIKRRACSGKKKYNEEDAKRASYHARRKTGDWILPYGCKFCKGWHIGHPPRKVRQAIIAKQKRRKIHG